MLKRFLGWFASLYRPEQVTAVVDLKATPSIHELHEYCLKLALYFKGMSPYQFDPYTIRTFSFVQNDFQALIRLLYQIASRGHAFQPIAPPVFELNQAPPISFFATSEGVQYYPADVMIRIIESIEDFLEPVLLDARRSYTEHYRYMTAPLTGAIVTLLKEFIAYEQSHPRP